MPENGSDSISRILSGSMVILAGSVIHKLIAFGGSVFIARFLGDTGYGIVVIALSMYFILSNILTLGLSGGIARNYPQSDTNRERRGILVTAYRIVSVTSIIGTLIVFLGAEPLSIYVFNDSSITPVLRVLAAIIPLKIILNLANGSFQAVKKPTVKAAITSILQPIIRVLLIIGLVFAGFGAVGVAGAYAVATGVTAVLSLYYVHRHTDLFRFGQPAKTVYWPLLAFSIPLVGSSILIKLMNNVDTLLIGSLATSADVGQYNVAFVLGQTTLLFLQTLGFMYVPEISELHAEKKFEQAEMIYRAITKWVLFISIPFIMTAMAFPTFVLTFIYSGEYVDATVPFIILIGGFLTHILNGPNHGTLMAFGDTRQLFIFDAVTVSLNFIFNFAFIPLFGIEGAATATALSYLVRNTAMTWYMNRTYGILPFSRWLFLPLLLTVAVAAVLRLIFPAPSFLFVITYAALLVVVIIIGYLSSGVEEADILLAELLEENIGVNLNKIREIHEKLR